MRHADLVAYCLAKPGAVPDTPWEEDLVAKVGGKIFAFLGGGGVGLKCGRDADEAAELRLRFPDTVTVMAYIGRYGWNSIALDGGSRNGTAGKRRARDMDRADLCGAHGKASSLLDRLVADRRWFAAGSHVRRCGVSFTHRMAA